MNLGFALNRSGRSRQPTKENCDTHFADDIPPLSSTLEQAQQLLSRVGTSAKQIGLHMNNSKTEYIKFNQGERDLKALTHFCR